jgi:hypothetical protein
MQKAHTDLLGILLYKDFLIPGVNLACSAILALEKKTFVYVYDFKNPAAKPKKIVIPPGHLFLFSGE